MSTTETTTNARFSGFWRRHRHERWQHLATGDSYDDAWGKLLDQLQLKGLRGGESLVVEGGRNPNTEVPRRRRCF